MPTERARYIADLLQVHADDLAFLWGQRREALTSPKYSLKEFAELNERIEAHTQGLLVPAPAELQAMLAPRLVSTERDEVFAAAYALLRLNEAASTRSVLQEFSRAQGPALAGLRDALSFAPHALFGAEVQKVLDQAEPPLAVAAAVVLANHRLLDGASPRLAALLQDEDPLVCALAWRVAAVVDAKAAQPPTRPFDLALTHAAPAVRHAAWSAVAWSGQAQRLPLLRERAIGGDAIAQHWLSVLGAQDDVPAVQKAALAIEDASARCALLARFGHPSALNALMRWMGGDDVALAVASGEAFTRITGIEIRGQRSTLPVPDDADDFAREMAPAVWLPDVAKARAAMEKHSADWASGVRWCKGARLDAAITREQLAQLDFEARWDAGARAALAGQRLSTPAPIH